VQAVLVIQRNYPAGDVAAVLLLLFLLLLLLLAVQSFLWLI